MRHRDNKKIELNLGAQKRSLVERSLLTNLVKHGAIKTTKKKAKVLKSVADKFFSKMVSMHTKLEKKDFEREAIRLTKATIFGEAEGKKVIREIVPMLIASKKTSGFIADYKLGARAGDAAEEILVKIAA